MRGEGGVKIGQNLVHVVCERPITERTLSFFYLINVSSIISIISEGTFENFVKTQEIY